MAGKITGRVQVFVNANLLLTKTGAVAGGIGESGKQAYERAEVIGENGISGFTETAVPATLEVTITDREDIMLNDFAQIFQNGTIIFKAANGGKSYKMEQATCLNNMSVTSGEGDTPLKFSGPYWTETSEAS